MSACEAALIANKSAVGADQHSYHEMLATSFQGMHERLEIFFGVSVCFFLLFSWCVSSSEHRQKMKNGTIHGQQFMS